MLRMEPLHPCSGLLPEVMSHLPSSEKFGADRLIQYINVASLVSRTIKITSPSDLKYGPFAKIEATLD